MQLVEAAVIRSSVSPTAPMAKVAKSAAIAWNIVSLQSSRITELEGTITQLQTKSKRTKKQLQSGGILDVQTAQEILLNRDLATQAVEERRADPARRRAPPTCSICHIQGHTRRCCPAIQAAS